MLAVKHSLAVSTVGWNSWRLTCSEPPWDEATRICRDFAVCLFLVFWISCFAAWCLAANRKGKKCFLPSALIHCAVFLSLQNCPGCGLLGKALGLRKELTPCLLYPAWINLLLYGSHVYTFSFVLGCMWLKYFCVSIKVYQVLKLFPMGTLSFQKEIVCCVWLTLALLMDAFLDPSQKEGSCVSLLSYYPCSLCKELKYVCNSTSCKSAPYTWCWNAWISWLKSLDCTIKNFTSLWTDEWPHPFVAAPSTLISEHHLLQGQN